MLVTSILKKKYRQETGKSEWALVSKSKDKVLKWFGATKPSNESVLKEERRVQFFKHKGKVLDKKYILKKTALKLNKN